jgi:hypothetical protein
MSPLKDGRMEEKQRERERERGRKRERERERLVFCGECMDF